MESLLEEFVVVDNVLEEIFLEKKEVDVMNYEEKILEDIYLEVLVMVKIELEDVIEEKVKEIIFLDIIFFEGFIMKKRRLVLEGFGGDFLCNGWKFIRDI